MVYFPWKERSAAQSIESGIGVTLRSGGETRRTLTRGNAQVYFQDSGTLVISNLVVHGGSVWASETDYTSTAKQLGTASANCNFCHVCSGVRGGGAARAAEVRPNADGEKTET